MVEKKLLVKSLKHYCDTIWEYEYSSDSNYIHCDKIADSFEEKRYPVGNLIAEYRAKFDFEAGAKVWEDYLNEGYLRTFFEQEKTSDDFQICFHVRGEELKYYSIRIEKIDDDNLMITGKNLFEEINERALHKSLRKSFDSILNIDIDTGIYFISYSVDPEDSEIASFNYEERMLKFIENHALDAEKETLRKTLNLKHIMSVLEKQEDYTIFLTIYDKKEGFAYKRIMYSYSDAKKKLITASRLDISNVVKRYEEQISKIRKENHKDTLTGAYNRNFYEVNIKDTHMDAGIAVIDIDDFKLCNDAYGHNAGDQFLAMVAKVIRETAPKEGTLIRYGGDEFVLLMPGIEQEKFQSILCEIRHRVRNEKIRGYEKQHLSLSIGGVIAKEETVESAVYRADRLMYKAKEQKNTVVTESDIEEDSKSQNSLYNFEKEKQQILIVDDSETNRLILSHMLQSDYRILEARNGDEALELIEQYGTGISLMLLDMVMPIKSGFEVLNYMNKMRLIEEIPVIMLTEEFSDEKIKKAYSMGVSDYLSRPFDSQTVYHRVSNTIMLYAKQRRLVSLIRQQHQSKENEKY